MATKAANAVFTERAADYVGSAWGDCEAGKPGYIDEGGWTGHGICYLDEQGRPNLRFVEDVEADCHPDPVTVGGTVVRKPTVYYGVLGTGGIRRLVRAWRSSDIWWAYPDGKRGALPGDTGAPYCRDIAPN
jgi:hypothetical protein